MKPKNKAAALTRKISKGEAVPWLWLEDGEDMAKDEVRGGGARGVVLVRDYNNGGPAVFISSEMKAAKELLAALCVINLTPKIVDYLATSDPKALEQVRAAIAKATAGA